MAQSRRDTPALGEVGLASLDGAARVRLRGRLWLGGSIVGIAVEIPVGVAWFCVGAIYVGGELWIERRGDRHPTFSVAWVAAWRAVLGTVMIVLGIVYLSWASIFLFAFGTWFLALAGFFSWALWRDHKLSETNRKAGA